MYQAVVIGVSAGGLEALSKIIPALQPDFPIPVLVVQHISPDSKSYLPVHLGKQSSVVVKEAEDKEILTPGVVYIAPPNYHLMIEPGGSIVLSVDERVNYSRPSVDVLFETAADAYGPHLIGIILTGANNDGAKGLARIKLLQGLTIVQRPETAHADAMPNAALAATKVDHILSVAEIAPFLNHITRQ